MMLSNSILMPILYAGLGGVVLSLIVATATNNWSCRVFFLLALRLAIGWHFLFEGLHKVHSHYAGPSEMVRPFSSEKYFELARGPLGEVMRERMGSVDSKLQARLTPQELPKALADLPPNGRLPRADDAPLGRRADGSPVITWQKYLSANPKGTVEEFEKEKLRQEVEDSVAFARMVPAAVVAEWHAFVETFANKYKLDDATKKRIDGTLDDSEKAEIFEQAELLARLPKTKDGAEKKKISDRLEELTLVGDFGVDALAAYGRWVAGTEPHPSQVKYVSGDTPLTAPQRLEYIANLEANLNALTKRTDADLGTGYGYEMNRVTDMLNLVSLAKSTLLSDTAALLTELKSGVFAAVMETRLLDEAPPPSKVVQEKSNLDALLPPEKAPEKPAFEAIPADVRSIWDNYFTAVKKDYPLDQNDPTFLSLDDMYTNTKTRFAAWYFDRNEFTGQPEPGFSILARSYRDAMRRAEDLRAKAQTDLPAFASLYTGAAAGVAAKNADDARQALIGSLDSKYSALHKALTDKSVMPEEVVTGPVTPPKPPSPMASPDWWTRWGITAIGAMLLLGLFTRVACLAGGIFLVLTYLAHPPFPWLPLPPGTEGNPVFINKNVIEFLGLMVVMVHPTGRWLGLEALIHRLVFRNNGSS
jgi:uncharacterized membrane protein YphA (DoxX/SURF4 family)